MHCIPLSRFPTSTWYFALDKDSLDSSRAAGIRHIQNFVGRACAIAVDTSIARRTTISLKDQQRTSNEKWFAAQRSAVATIAMVLARFSEAAVGLLELPVEPFAHRGCTDLDGKAAVGNFELAGHHRTGLHSYRILAAWGTYSTTAVALLELVAGGELRRMDWTLLSAIFAVDRSTFAISSDDRRFELVEAFAVKECY